MDAAVLEEAISKEYEQRGFDTLYDADMYSDRNFETTEHDPEVDTAERDFDDALFKALGYCLDAHVEAWLTFKETEDNVTISTTDVYVLKGSWTRGGWTFASGVATHVRRGHLHLEPTIGLDTEGFETYQKYQDHSVVLLVKQEGESDGNFVILESLCGVELKTCDSSSCRLEINGDYETIGFQHELGSKDAVLQATTYALAFDWPCVARRGLQLSSKQPSHLVPFGVLACRLKGRNIFPGTSHWCVGCLHIPKGNPGQFQYSIKAFVNFASDEQFDAAAVLSYLYVLGKGMELAMSHKNGY